jgi:protein-disulfide isomerase
MLSIGRRKLMAGAAALALAGACGNGGGSAGATSRATGDDMVIGADNAPVTLLEYGSAMCSHCREFEEASFDALKTEYIDTGKVKFIFREALAPVSPDGSGTIESITLAMYQVSRCGNATPEQYFTRLGVFFEQQPAIFQAGTMQNVRNLLMEIGRASGLSEEQITACIADPAGAQRIQRLGDAFTRDGQAAGLAPAQMGTPMFFLDGVHLDTDSMMTPAGLRAVLDAAIAAKS